MTAYPTRTTSNNSSTNFLMSLLFQSLHLMSIIITHMDLNISTIGRIPSTRNYYKGFENHPQNIQPLEALPHNHQVSPHNQIIPTSC